MLKEVLGEVEGFNLLLGASFSSLIGPRKHLEGGVARRGKRLFDGGLEMREDLYPRERRGGTCRTLEGFQKRRSFRRKKDQGGGGSSLGNSNEMGPAL